MKILRLLLVLVTLSSFIPDTYAGMITFQREYTYQASEADSKISSRAIALEQAKRQLLEEIGIYMESKTEIKNMNLTNEQITTITAGVVQAKITEEKWDGQKYHLRARIDADPDEVVKAIEYVRQDYKKTKQLEIARKQMDEALQEIERLKHELASRKTAGTNLINNQKEYNASVKKVQEAANTYDSFRSSYDSAWAKQSSEFRQWQEDAKRAEAAKIGYERREAQSKHYKALDQYYKNMRGMTPKQQHEYLHNTTEPRPKGKYKPTPPLQQHYSGTRKKK